jgi:hypothetical protein
MKITSNEAMVLMFLEEFGATTALRERAVAPKHTPDGGLWTTEREEAAADSAPRPPTMAESSV